MDRVELRKKISGRVKSFLLDEIHETVFLRYLSAAERAQFIDKSAGIIPKGEDPKTYRVSLEQVTKELQCFLISRALIDESGKRCYPDDEAVKIADEMDGPILEAIQNEIMEMNKLIRPGNPEAQAEEIKNLDPAPNGSFSSDSLPASKGGMSINS